MLNREIELSELKSRFVSMAAHDLRNPLAVIQSAISLLHQYSDQLTLEQKQARYDRIQTSIKVMVDMLDDILTIGQAEAGKLKFDPAPLDLIAFCQNITEEMRQITGSIRQIGFSSQGNCGMVYMDARLLWHIFDNLLSNAFKYSPEESAVKFTVDCEQDQIIFRIQDEGIGIPQADQARLFEAFHRASNVKQVPGTGLGLTIVKLFVELHGGTLSFDSAEGQGAEFTVTLPLIDPPNTSG
jgi:signal transduction histidine kinase